MIDRCLTPRELARRWRCRVAKVRAMIKSGFLFAISLEGRLRILPESIGDAETSSLAVRKQMPRKKKDAIPADIVKLLNE